VDHGPYLVDTEHRGLRFPKIVYAYGHVVRPIVHTADVQCRRNHTQVERNECDDNVVDVLTAKFSSFGI